MKSLAVKKIIGSLVVAVLALPTFGQTIIINSIRSTPSKRDTIIIPKAITKSYEQENPLASHISWYGYPTLENDAAWYDYQPNASMGKSENYSVEFVKGKTHQKAIYGKNGKKLATHGPLTSALPEAIFTAIHNSIYKGWILSKQKEQISQESDKSIVYYKLLLEKGNQKHTLFFLANGTLVKDKKIV